MKKTVRKCFWAWDFDREEKWLNEMAKEGMVLCSVGFCKYKFEKCEPGEYEIRLELLEKQIDTPESREYISFVEETGAEYIDNYLRWVYFKKKKEETAFELFSDNASKIKHLNRIIAFLLPINSANLAVGIYNLWVWAQFNSAPNAFGLVNVITAALVFLGIGKIKKKRNALEKERELYE